MTGILSAIAVLVNRVLIKGPDELAGGPNFLAAAFTDSEEES